MPVINKFDFNVSNELGFSKKFYTKVDRVNLWAFSAVKTKI